ncbi:endo-1,4-beta-xylanase [Carboxylicivirga sp. N1Y90]|uniref:endo-1,4-beta-xylanase n=1 Tax=Carboxylicivirga fragile TaxID=3417571 RepID=UPI003D33BE7A|nr:endo-1,4-beta-xylanase [Marinilabiliaceae bacterium N1Y90]
MKKMKLVVITVISILSIADLSAQEPIRKIVERISPDKSLYIGATSMYSKIGTKESKILAREFSYTTPANDFKQSYVHPNPQTWRWDRSDAWIKFAKKHKQVIRIHGPISPQCSRWAKNDERSHVELLTNLSEYMTELCRRYNDEEVVVWMDVINETVSRDGTWKTARLGDNSWELPWEAIGYEQVDKQKYPHLDGKVPIYIIRAFEIATQEATNKKLVINQHGSMSPLIWNKIKDLVRYLRDNNYKVDGIGWQAHISYGRDVEWESPEVSIKALKELIAWSHKNKLEFHVTECNIHVPSKEPGTEEQHIATYMNIFNAVLEMRQSGVVTFNLWNIKDVPHYKNKNKLVIAPWDANLKPKAIYSEMNKALLNASATSE